MTAFTTLVNALFLPGKRILGATGMALRDNLLACLEGDPTAHAAMGGIRLAAVEKLIVGDSARLQRPDLVNQTGSTFTLVAGTEFTFMQSGAIRIKFTQYRSASGTSDVRVRRTRARVTSTVVTLSTTTPSPGVAQSTDVDILAGDVLWLEQRNTVGAQSSTVENMQWCLATGSYLWPTESMMGVVEGNP